MGRLVPVDVLLNLLGRSQVHPFACLLMYQIRSRFPLGCDNVLIAQLGITLNEFFELFVNCRSLEGSGLAAIAS
jgi:hypothetical protein